MLKSTSSSIHFGFLFFGTEFSFDQGRVTPTRDFDSISKRLSKILDVDGYLYPPTMKEVQFDSISGKQSTLRRKRPVFQFWLPASHELILKSELLHSEVKEESAALIMYLIGLIFNTRLQFSDWFIDGRISMHPKERPVIASYPAILGNQISLAYERWARWSITEQRRFLNILYLFSRSDVYQWDWEKFLLQYMILDSCWKMGQRLFNFNAKRHSNRAKELYGHFALHHPILDSPGELSDLRNDLFHEGTWHNGRPGNVGLMERKGCYDHAIALAWLNEGVIMSFLGLE